MFQPLNGNIRINRFTNNRLILILLLIILIVFTLIIEDKFTNPKCIYFYDGNKLHFVRTHEETVDAFLRSMNVSLNKGDILLNSLSQNLTDSIEIRLIRVKEELDIEEEIIKFDKNIKICADLDDNIAYELRSGKNGKKQKYYKVVYQNDVQKIREFIDEFIIEYPCEQIIIKGNNSLDNLLIKPFVCDAYFSNESIKNYNLQNDNLILGIALINQNWILENSIIEVGNYGKFIVKNKSNNLNENIPIRSNNKLPYIKLILPFNLSNKLKVKNDIVQVRLI